MMTCQEFESLGPDFERHPVSRAAAEEHLRSRPRCAALLNSWKDLDGELRALALETSSAEAPLRVELALREAVRGLRPRPRAARLVPVWVLGPAAAAAVAIFAVWYVLHSPQKPASPSPSLAAQPPVDRYAVTNNKVVPAASEELSQKASGPQKQEPRRNPSAPATQDSAGEFVALPYALPVTSADDASVIRVRLQRAALGAFGLPVNEERAAEWVMVDLLIGADGQPEAFRLAR